MACFQPPLPHPSSLRSVVVLRHVGFLCVRAKRAIFQEVGYSGSEADSTAPGLTTVMEATIPNPLSNRRRSTSLGGLNIPPSGGPHESLIAVCMLMVASLTMGIMFYALRDILIPLAFSLLFFYILQPVVTFLTKPPVVCFSDLCKTAEEEIGDIPFAERFRRLCAWTTDDTIGRKGSFGMYGTVEEGAPIHGEGPREGGGWQTGVEGDGTRRPSNPRRRALVRLIYSLRCPRWLAIILAISLAVGVFVVFGFMVYSAIISVEDDWPIYEAGAERVARRLKAWLAELHVSLDDDLVPYVMDYVKGYIPKLIKSVWLVVANGLLVSIFLLYLLSTPPQAMPPGVWRKIDVHIRRYIRLKAFICLIISAVVFVILYFLHVPFAGLFGFITFVLNFIPNFGPIVATLLPLPLVAFNPHLGMQSKALSIILPAAAHFLCGYWLEPRVFGEHLELHPIIILIALAFWGVLWGVAGMILSVPLISLIKIISQHLEHPYARVVVRVLEGRMLDFDVEASMTAYHTSGSQTAYHIQNDNNNSILGGAELHSE